MWQRECCALPLLLFAAAAALGALLRHPWLAGVCLVAKLLPEFVDFELKFLKLAHAK
jgi:hypothetical protein